MLKQENKLRRLRNPHELFNLERYHLYIVELDSEVEYEEEGVDPNNYEPVEYIAPYELGSCAALSFSGAFARLKGSIAMEYMYEKVEIGELEDVEGYDNVKYFVVSMLFDEMYIDDKVLECYIVKGETPWDGGKYNAVIDENPVDLKVRFN